GGGGGGAADRVPADDHVGVVRRIDGDGLVVPALVVPEVHVAAVIRRAGNRDRIRQRAARRREGRAAIGRAQDVTELVGSAGGALVDRFRPRVHGRVLGIGRPAHPPRHAAPLPGP